MPWFGHSSSPSSPQRTGNSAAEDCPQCPVIQDQLAGLLEQINSLQEELAIVRRERDVYLDSCDASRTDLKAGNTKFLEQRQEINELRDKVKLYTEAQQMLFEKCATVSDLEGEVLKLRDRIHELEKINWRGGEPHSDNIKPSRELALRHLSEQLDKASHFASHYLEPLGYSTSTTSG
ncbi:hypothetical protein BV898_17540 [Hypsibius exemplaris]|uniref:Uncharacterized protein n=1 Tax=Hypsibius exemplaris TaxID=2072580 RepID=A0A9X6RMM9_HYPEX|nr:hypothetical protein BV898_17540 [Hypsibius exemplaris]